MKSRTELSACARVPLPLRFRLLFDGSVSSVFIALHCLSSLGSLVWTMHWYTVARKVEVVEWHRRHGKNASRTSREFKIDRKRVRECDSKYELLLQQNHSKSRLKRKLSDGAPIFTEEVDDALFEFLEDQRRAGRVVCNRLLEEEAIPDGPFPSASNGHHFEFGGRAEQGHTRQCDPSAFLLSDLSDPEFSAIIPQF